MAGRGARAPDARDAARVVEEPAQLRRGQLPRPVKVEATPLLQRVDSADAVPLVVNEQSVLKGEMYSGQWGKKNERTGQVEQLTSAALKFYSGAGGRIRFLA